MDYSKLEHYVSQPRLNKFLRASGNSKSKAQKLYRINLRVSQSFYPILNLFEIFFRNAVDYQISSHFADPNWITNETNGFMSDKSLSKGNFFLRQSVLKTVKSINTIGGTVTAGKIMAEQTFGFWTSFFNTPHYKLIRGSVIHCFPYKPAIENRSSINQKLKRIREFRNRIYHNEPICFDTAGAIDFSNAENIKNDIYDLFSWIDPDLSDYADYFNGIDAKINSINFL